MTESTHVSWREEAEAALAFCKECRGWKNARIFNDCGYPFILEDVPKRLADSLDPCLGATLSLQAPRKSDASRCGVVRTVAGPYRWPAWSLWNVLRGNISSLDQRSAERRGKSQPDLGYSLGVCQRKKKGACPASPGITMDKNNATGRNCPFVTPGYTPGASSGMARGAGECPPSINPAFLW